ncbi:ribonuclease HI [Salisaeta longa]|uniref:ribonuclease HI n=1 Tax=Salisaeta longa TaxID=503170 RepID=UPI0003B672EF|nr:ribonuclease HI [Salisaeta longa]
MDTVTIYTDGACSGNPGPGGWAAIIVRDEHTMDTLEGGTKHTTNNRMELTAALRALESLEDSCTVKLHTDSAYLSRAFNDGWIEGWKKRGWRTSSKKPVKNKDLWQQLIAQDKRHDVEWIWVKGHADNPLNNMADERAVAAMEPYK